MTNRKSYAILCLPLREAGNIENPKTVKGLETGTDLHEPGTWSASPQGVPQLGYVNTQNPLFVMGILYPIAINFNSPTWAGKRNTMENNEIKITMINGVRMTDETPWTLCGFGTEAEMLTQRKSEIAQTCENAISEFMHDESDDDENTVTRRDYMKKKYMGSQWEVFKFEIKTAVAKYHDGGMTKKQWDDIRGHFDLAYKAVAHVTGNPIYRDISRKQVKFLFSCAPAYREKTTHASGETTTYFAETDETPMIRLVSRDLYKISHGYDRMKIKANKNLTDDSLKDSSGAGYKRGTVTED